MPEDHAERVMGMLTRHLFGIRFPYGPNGQQEATHTATCPCYGGKPPFVESPAARHEEREVEDPDDPFRMKEKMKASKIIEPIMFPIAVNDAIATAEKALATVVKLHKEKGNEQLVIRTEGVLQQVRELRMPPGRLGRW